MEFLKAIFGEKPLTYDEFVQAVNAHNGNEANKDNQVKIGNLASGEYVGKGKHDALNEMLSGKQKELDTANGLIEQLKKSAKGNEELQGKFAQYENEKAALQKELAETKIKSAVKVALLSEKAIDIDYLTYKVNETMREKGITLELDENEHIKGWDDVLSSLKTQCPNQFESGKNGQSIEANPLPEQDNNRPSVTREQFSKMGYESRVKLKESNPELYAQMKG